ncbi:MAG: 23S rRNA (uracil(1939)-C(5))-methyltransferase RlmD [Aquificae bacterium]|nr:23S rRNA (uracil(1939)-C(5))-methyltransferase RlmD [Aquificota bacterium]
MEVKIEKLVYGGKGLGRINDKACFVPYVLPGEIVEVEIKKEKKSFFECELKEILEKSPDRIEPVCKYFTYCGGCDYQHIPYEKQLQIKKDILKETLQRIGKIENPHIEKVIPSQEPFYYRNRTQIKIKGERVGFYKKESKEIINIDYCYLLKEDLNHVLQGTREILPYLTFQPVEVHAYSSNQDELLVKFVYPRRIKRFPLGLKHLRSFLSENIKGVGIYRGKPDGTTERLFTIGNIFAYEKVQDITFRVSIDSFFQVNRFQVENLINEVVEEFKEKKYKNVIDFYCGVGTLTLPVARYVENIVGIESNPYAVQDANHNRKLNNIKNTKFYRMESKEGVKLIDQLNPDAVILDPPRTGLSKQIIDKINISSIEKVVYVSCNPSTLARDINLFTEAGFEVKKIKMIDMFPQTYHIESITVLEK